MAKESARDKPAEELSEEIDRSRELVARSLSGVRYELDFPRKIRRSFRRQTFAWITAAAVVGLLLAVQPARKKKICIDSKRAKKPAGTILEAGFVLGALKIAASLLKPLAVSFLKKKVTEYASGSRSSRKR
jgi:hypothetical protein